MRLQPLRSILRPSSCSQWSEGIRVQSLGQPRGGLSWLCVQWSPLLFRCGHPLSFPDMLAGIYSSRVHFWPFSPAWVSCPLPLAAKWQQPGQRLKGMIPWRQATGLEFQPSDVSLFQGKEPRWWEKARDKHLLQKALMSEIQNRFEQVVRRKEGQLFSVGLLKL